jgi:hypothetical protein
MKKLLIVLMCLGFAASTYAQAAKSAQASETLQDKNGPKFKFKGGDVHDFGKIPEGPVAEYTFEFTNVGKAPLIIQNASASCGCTTPEWPKEPILPGKTGKIKVRYNTQGRGNQPFDKSVYISSNASTNNERYELHIKGFVTGADQATGKK